MSRTEEVNKMTENVYKVESSALCPSVLWRFGGVGRIKKYLYCVTKQQGILDQFNPSLKNFVTMGKHYEKALTGSF